MLGFVKEAFEHEKQKQGCPIHRVAMINVRGI